MKEKEGSQIQLSFVFWGAGWMGTSNSLTKGLISVTTLHNSTGGPSTLKSMLVVFPGLVPKQLPHETCDPQTRCCS